MLSRLNITAKGFILVLLPVAFQVVFALIFISMLVNSAGALEYLQHSLSAITDMSRRYSVTLAQACVVLNRDERDVGKKLQALEKITKSTEWIDQTSSSRNRFPELAGVESDVADLHSALMQATSKVGKVISAPGFDPSSRKELLTLPETLPLFMEAQSLNDRLFGIERQMVSSQPQELEKFRNIFYTWLAAAVLGSCLLSIWLGQAFSQDVVQRLDDVIAQATKILVEEPLPKPESGTDEISQLEKILFDTSIALSEARRCELAILENATHIFCTLDSSLKFHRVVQNAHKSWGFIEDELRGRSLLSLLTIESKQGTADSFAAIISNGGTAQAENVIRCKDNVLRTFAWTVNWQPQENLFYCVVSDVTEIRSLENLRKNFLAMVSSDLREPLRAVTDCLQNLDEERVGKLPSGAKSRIELARRNNNRLSKLIDELLNVEKLKQGKANLDLECIKISQVCSLAAEQLNDLADKSGIQIVQPADDAEVLVDAGRILQVLVNLLSNAIKFSPVDSKIEFDVKLSDEFVEIGIKDHGPGIPLEHQTLIFSRFHQVKSGTAKGIKGSGLGLAIVQSLVVEHGGSVGVESVLGAGSRFWIRLPKHVFIATESGEVADI